MQIAYIISAYKLPEQLERLMRRLAAPGVSFTVHIDRKSSRRTYDEMVARTRDLDVCFLSRHVSHWGGFGHVRATLKGIERLVDDGVDFDYAVLLTGQDYPLCAPAAISGTLERANGRSFMNHWRLPRPAWGPRGGLDRIEDWHLITYRRVHIALPLQRRIPVGLEPWGGGAYWCLSSAVVRYVQDFVVAHPEIVRFFEHVFIPDELFFQTLIMNSPLSGSIENDNLRYIDWSREPAPAVLTLDDLPRLKACGKLFARKFDVSVDRSILDALDELVPDPHVRGR